MLKFSVKADGFDELHETIAQACTKAEHIVALQARKDTAPYVPFLTGFPRPQNTGGRECDYLSRPIRKVPVLRESHGRPGDRKHLRAERRDKGTDRQKSCVQHVRTQSGAIALV